ncbi:hypothetical protein MSAN_00579500 [Mycena sanguinolenta]|uniref:Transmembrane protein n=1 Tax=Mycena sanguinolenta TaxID=230812 RepID=A0A8H6ZDI7_9AGAR|nr:hypothetical protein MSAN_00579500 [Mycena sanguinolenta]
MAPKYVLRWYDKAWVLSAVMSMLWAPFSAWILWDRMIIPAQNEVAVTSFVLILFLFVTHKGSLFVARLLQICLYLLERPFSKKEYYGLLVGCCVLVVFDLVWVVYSTNVGFNMFERMIVYGYLVHNFLSCAIELCFIDKFRQHLRDIMVVRAAEYFVKADSVSQISTRTRILRKIQQILSWFGRPQGGYIALPDDHTLEMDASLAASTGSPPLSFNLHPELKENIVHWSRMSSNSRTSKPLWVTTRNYDRCIEFSRTVAEFLSSTDGDSMPAAAFVDVSRTHAVFWPLIRGLMSVSPEYIRKKCQDYVASDSVSSRHNPVDKSPYW